MKKIIEALRIKLKEIGIGMVLSPQTAVPTQKHIELVFVGIETIGDSAQKKTAYKKITFRAQFKSRGTHEAWMIETMELSDTLCGLLEAPMILDVCGYKIDAYWSRTTFASIEYDDDVYGSVMPALYTETFKIEIQYPNRILKESEMKPSGKDGRLYNKKFGEELIGASESVPLAKSGFYRIDAIASAASGLPVNDATVGSLKIASGYTYWLNKGLTLKVGDKITAITLEPVGFVKDVPMSQQGSSFDNSTQENLESGVKGFAQGAFSEASGTINGAVDVDSQEQRVIISIFNEITIDDGEKITRIPASQNPLNFMLSYRETKTVGETEMWRDMPIIVDQISMSKPMDGNQEFSFNYKIDGNRKPHIIYRTVKETT